MTFLKQAVKKGNKFQNWADGLENIFT